MDRVRFYPHCFHAWEGEAKPHRLRPRWQQQVAGLCHRVLPGVVERYGGAGVVTATVLYLAGMGESVSSGNMELANSAQGVEVDFYFCFLSLEQLMWGSHEEGCRAAVQPGGQCWGCSASAYKGDSWPCAQHPCFLSLFVGAVTIGIGTMMLKVQMSSEAMGSCSSPCNCAKGACNEAQGQLPAAAGTNFQDEKACGFYNPY